MYTEDAAEPAAARSEFRTTEPSSPDSVASVIGSCHGNMNRAEELVRLMTNLCAWCATPPPPAAGLRQQAGRREPETRSPTRPLR